MLRTQFLPKKKNSDECRDFFPRETPTKTDSLQHCQQYRLRLTLVHCDLIFGFEVPL